MLLAALLACNSPPPACAEDCLTLTAPDARDDCLSVYAVNLFKTDPERGISVVEEQVSEQQIRDFIWLQVTREVDPGSVQYCARIADENLRARCVTLVMRPHMIGLYDTQPAPPGPGFAPARFIVLDATCTDSCAPLLEDAPLTGVLEHTLTVDPPEQTAAVEAALRRRLGQLGNVHSIARGRCPCLDAQGTFTITLADGRADVSIADTDLASQDASLFAGRLSRDWPLKGNAHITLHLTLTSQAQP